jgi:AcrR family transcriptional regulator
LASAPASAPPRGSEAGRPRRTQAERSETSRRLLLDAAFDLVIERGSLNFTLSDVGERAGYSRGLPSQVFGSKAGLVNGLVEHLITVSLEMSLQDPNSEGLTAVLKMVGLALEVPEGQRRISIGLQVLVSEAHQTESPIRDAVIQLARASAGYVSKNLRIAIAAGDVRPEIDPRAQGVMLMSGMHGALRQWLLDPRRIDIAMVRREMLGNLIRALAVDPTPWLAKWVGSPAG